MGPMAASRTCRQQGGWACWHQRCFSRPQRIPGHLLPALTTPLPTLPPCRAHPGAAAAAAAGCRGSSRGGTGAGAAAGRFPGHAEEGGAGRRHPRCVYGLLGWWCCCCICYRCCHFTDPACWVLCILANAPPPTLSTTCPAHCAPPHPSHPAPLHHTTKQRRCSSLKG